MGRKSKLSAEQWAEVERRAATESRRALAREFGVSDSTLREHLERAETQTAGPTAEPVTGKVQIRAEAAAPEASAQCLAAESPRNGSSSEAANERREALSAAALAAFASAAAATAGRSLAAALALRQCRAD